MSKCLKTEFRFVNLRKNSNEFLCCVVITNQQQGFSERKTRNIDQDAHKVSNSALGCPFLSNFWMFLSTTEIHPNVFVTCFGFSCVSKLSTTSTAVTFKFCVSLMNYGYNLCTQLWMLSHLQTDQTKPNTTNRKGCLISIQLKERFYSTHVALTMANWSICAQRQTILKFLQLLRKLNLETNNKNKTREVEVTFNASCRIAKQ